MTTHSELANAIRSLSIDAIEKSKSGHPGLPMGMADVCTVLFQKFLNFNPENPDWANRDRFVLSAGHGSMLLYSLLYLSGYRVSIDDIKDFRQYNSKTPGHPEYKHTPGVETTTGPLGQGIANGVGMALGEAMMKARFPDLIDHKTYVLVGDGCLMEGISQEAISFAGHLNLKDLVVLYDSNAITIDGKTDISTSEDAKMRFESCGWNVLSIDGHNPEEIEQALTTCQTADKPSVVICTTTIGYGSPNKQGTEKVHGSPLGAEEAELTKKALGWGAKPFEVPEAIKASWLGFAKKGQDKEASWKQKDISKLTSYLSNEWKVGLAQDIAKVKNDFITNNAKLATRKAGQIVLETVAKIPNLIGGSADLTGSNLTKVGVHTPVKTNDFSGNYLYYGVREHGMSAIMNGLATYGFKAYGGTFLVFSDYARNAIRLSAMMGLPVMYVFTHDSIGLGEDGPTHQPVEHLSSLRAIPNLNVFRPCDGVEAAESWELALSSDTTPSIFALSRQGVPTLRTDFADNSVNQTAKGGYVLWQNKAGEADLTIIASGTEVSLAVEVAQTLSKGSMSAKTIHVVSMPCLDLFKQLSLDEQDAIVSPNSKKVVIEAGIRMSWDFLLGREDYFFGVETFGVSAPIEDAYRHFGITKENIVKTISV